MFRGFGHQSGSKISGNQANVIITHFAGLVIKRQSAQERISVYGTKTSGNSENLQMRG